MSSASASVGVPRRGERDATRVLAQAETRAQHSSAARTGGRPRPWAERGAGCRWRRAGEQLRAVRSATPPPENIAEIKSRGTGRSLSPCMGLDGRGVRTHARRATRPPPRTAVKAARRRRSARPPVPRVRRVRHAVCTRAPGRPCAAPGARGGSRTEPPERLACERGEPSARIRRQKRAGAKITSCAVPAPRALRSGRRVCARWPRGLG